MSRNVFVSIALNCLGKTLIAFSSKDDGVGRAKNTPENSSKRFGEHAPNPLPLAERLRFELRFPIVSGNSISRCMSGFAMLFIILQSLLIFNYFQMPVS